MKINKTKARLKAGETVFGCFVRYPEATLIEVLGYQPWDFLVFDGEHGVVEPRDVENLVRSAELRDVTPIVRVPTNQPWVILRMLDTGAQGLHVPWVNTAAEAEAAVRAVKYGPRGIRGLAGVRAADFGQAGPLGDYVKQANEQTLVILHVETADAVRQLPEMIKVPDIDVIFIGPTDLSHSYGAPGQPQHPDVQAAMKQIADVVLPSDKALGIMVPNLEGALAWRDKGARYITITLENLMTPAIKTFLNAVQPKR